MRCFGPHGTPSVQRICAIHNLNTETLQSMHFIGCLFVLLFGAIFLLFAFSRYIIGWLYDTLVYRLFGVKPPRRNNQTYSSSQSSQTSTKGPGASAGNAHHEGQSGTASSSRRTGKIFSHDEGTYVDFEEIKS